jgi:EAL domain-containing protein (putative c-di-GMP-specific phosphodiesterase class I)
MLIEGGTTREAYELATRIGQSFAEPTVIDGVSLQSNVSVGIALYPEHAADPDGLMQRADAAMYRAKQGGTGVSLFTPEQSSAGIRRLQLLGDLRTAIASGELTLHYQPRVVLATGEIEGLEALVRWNHPQLGLLPPDEFIGLAEVSGLIQDLTRFVIRAAAADNARLGEIGHLLPVAVNLSVRNLYSPDLTEGILRSLEEFSLPAERLRVELTESEIMDDPALAMQVLQRLRSEGIEVSIDDFGTGYSSLSYLRDLPIDEIKIDRSFVADISDGDDVVVRSIIDLGHALGVAVVGEGVETAQQWDHLRRLGCDVAQGYLVSRPLPYEELVRFLDDRRDFDGHPVLSRGSMHLR